MRREEAGCYLEINMATGNIDRIATDTGVMERHLRGKDIHINAACGGFCQHSLKRCLRIADKRAWSGADERRAGFAIVRDGNGDG